MSVQRMPFIRTVDEGALSEDEDACASHGFMNMMLNLEKRSSICRDDMDLSGQGPETIFAPQGPSSPLKKRKALIKALGAEPANLLKVEPTCRKQSEDASKSRANSMDETMDGSSARHNDAASVASASAFSMSFYGGCKNTNDEEVKSTTDDSDEIAEYENSSQERLLTQAERDAFFAPPTLKTDVLEFKPSSLALPVQSSQNDLPVPSQLLPETIDAILTAQKVAYSQVSESDEFNYKAYEPAYKQKEKTEICKYWLYDNYCKFGDECAFAHGEHELIKKTHVASKFRMTLCNSYLSKPGFCIYGTRCQFCHLSRDFSDFDQQRTRYQNLLDENAKIMKSRIDQVAEPDVSTFNIAMPSKRRLAVFDQYCPTDTNTHSKKDSKKSGQKKQGNSKKANYQNKGAKRTQPKSQ